MSGINEQPACSSAMACAFPWFAWVLVSAGLGMVTLRMSEAADKGVIDWISYPAFILLSAGMFVIYGVINRWQQ